MRGGELLAVVRGKGLCVVLGLLLVVGSLLGVGGPLLLGPGLAMSSLLLRVGVGLGGGGENLTGRFVGRLLGGSGTLLLVALGALLGRVGPLAQFGRGGEKGLERVVRDGCGAMLGVLGRARRREETERFGNGGACGEVRSADAAVAVAADLVEAGGNECGS